MELAIPELREGSYFPGWLLESRRRSEKALVQVVADCYLAGVSTRRVDKLVKQLGLDGIPKVPDVRARQVPRSDRRGAAVPAAGCLPYTYVWVDALSQKVRERGRIVHVAVVHAVGVNADGHRETLGMDVITTEDGAGWTAFLSSLVARGLSGVQLVISDAHCGRADAVAAVLPGASWQRCRTHFMRNLLSRVPKSAQGIVAPLVRSIFDQPDAESAWARHARIVEQSEGRFDAAVGLPAEAAGDILAFAAFQKAHWRQIWSNNPSVASPIDGHAMTSIISPLTSSPTTEIRRKDRYPEREMTVARLYVDQEHARGATCRMVWRVVLVARRVCQMLPVSSSAVTIVAMPIRYQPKSASPRCSR